MGHGGAYSLEMVVLTCFINFYFINSLLQTLQHTIHCWPWIQATGKWTSPGRLSVEWIHRVTLSKQISNTWNIHNFRSNRIHAQGYFFLNLWLYIKKRERGKKNMFMQDESVHSCHSKMKCCINLAVRKSQKQKACWQKLSSLEILYIHSFLLILL